MLALVDLVPAQGSSIVLVGLPFLTEHFMWQMLETKGFPDLDLPVTMNKIRVTFQESLLTLFPSLSQK